MTPRVFIDQEARTMARDAVNQITAHEKECAAYRLATVKTLDEIKRILAYGTAGLITTMATLIGWLATHPPH